MIKLTNHKKGLKLEGFLSLNTAPSCNTYCNLMASDKERICSQCYGRYMERRYPRAKKVWTDNFNELTTQALSFADAYNLSEQINNKKNLRGFRIHSIGEIYNTLHMENIAMLVSFVDADIPVTMWTKRLTYVKNLYSRLQCNLIYSNPIINTYVPVNTVWTENCDVLHTFNVYSDLLLMQADMAHAVNYQGYDVVECSGNCKDCMICYPSFNSSNTRFMIFELSKRTKHAVQNDL